MRGKEYRKLVVVFGIFAGFHLRFLHFSISLKRLLSPTSALLARNVEPPPAPAIWVNIGSSSLVTTMLPVLSFRKSLLPSVIGIGARLGQAHADGMHYNSFVFGFFSHPYRIVFVIFTIGDDDDGFAPFEVR